MKKIRSLNRPDLIDASKSNEEATMPFLKGDIRITWTQTRQDGLLTVYEAFLVLFENGFFHRKS